MWTVLWYCIDLKLPPLSLSLSLSLSLALYLSLSISPPHTHTSSGIPNPPSVTAYLQDTQSSTSQRHHSLSEMGKDALSSQAVISVTEHLFDVLEACGDLFEDCKWIKRWQRLSRRYVCVSFSLSLFLSLSLSLSLCKCMCVCACMVARNFEGENFHEFLYFVPFSTVKAFSMNIQ